jgi:hypothetical protein
MSVRVSNCDRESPVLNYFGILHLIPFPRMADNRKAQNDGEEDGSSSSQANNAYYGYGYYNAYGEWVTPFKTMFQIQYFNVVLWTSVGLVVVLFFVIYLMIDMPLEADTLLFGESAKIGD